MIKTFFRQILIIQLLIFPIVLFGQEKIMQLPSNPRLSQQKDKATKSVKAGTLTLPFFDDFTINDVYPDQNLWKDKDAFINNDYAYQPISFGVATLDAVNKYGNIHEHLEINICGVSDYLTSRPIRLDSIFTNEGSQLTPSDSVYLSFFFQPNNWDTRFISDEGLAKDSLVLEFYDAVAEEWCHVWSTKRFPYDSIKPEENKGWHFIEVVIPIVDEKFFNKDFQFRFKNYVTLTQSNNYPGWQVNTSQWNIDYVYLDLRRTYNGYYKDICFSNEAHSFLKNYYSMPYNQYSDNAYDEMLEYDTMQIANLDNSSNNVGYSFVVTNAAGTAIKTYQGGSNAITPFYQSGFYNNPSVYPAVFPYTFPMGIVDSAIFHITHIITSDLNFKQNDTIKFDQKFYNYYAYDDGTPEYSYTIESPGNAHIAIRFKLNVADTLQAINIYFSDIKGIEEETTCNLCVWNENNRLPYEIKAKQTITHYKDTIHTNNFRTFKLEKPLYINNVNFPYLVFYIGIETASNQELALGYDNSKNSINNTLYNVSGQWENSSYPGTIMMRPVLGKPFEITGIQDVTNQAEDFITVYPNPVSANNVNISFAGSDEYYDIILCDSYGRRCMASSRNNYEDIVSLNIADLKSGVYFIILYSASGVKTAKKIIICR